ncbi:hypothetical protein PBRA_001026 [Plasmodiophora brassicae]|nr:hypothetical protein PBRA_001026 [Plasmodiophora brassicae]
MADEPCHVCDAASARYRCPACRVARYCSVACYKSHTATGCAPTAPVADDQRGTADAARSLGAEPSEWVLLTDADRALIERSEEVQGALRSRELRDIIRDLAGKPCQALADALERNQHLVDFTDTLLRTISFEAGRAAKDRT